MDASSTGTLAPTPMPISSGSAAPKVMAPVPASVSRRPTAEELLCSTAVMAAPARKPRTGLENAVMTSANTRLSFSGATAVLMAEIPYIRTAKPRRIPPRERFHVFLEIMRRRIPMMATTPVMVAVDTSFSHPLPLMVERLTTQPVTLVPTMEPRMMLMA